VIVYGATDADPPYTEQCRKLITELQLNETLQLAGNHPRPHEMYVEGDITVLSSISEGFPYVVIESMACERPVVATDVGGVREAIADTGVVVPPKDPAALAQGMVTLLANPAHRAELGRRARERVLAQFVTENVLDNYWDLYHRLAHRERSGLGAACHAPVAATSV
jgi:glycosyltransferase involved in cell wall biosynthesis